MNAKVFRALIMVNQFTFSVLGPIVMMVAIGLFVRQYFNFDIVLICLILGVLAGARNGYMFAKKAFEINNKN